MTGRGRYNSGDEHDLYVQIRDLRRRLEDIEALARAGHTGVDRGRFAVYQDDGSILFETGEIGSHIAIPGAFGTSIRRENGTFALTVHSTLAGSGFWALYDKNGTIIASEDGSSGQGLATPWIPLSNWAINSGTFPAGAELTTSSTFVGIWNVSYVKQHPKLRVDILVRSSGSGTTGEVQVVQLGTGDVIGGFTVADGQYGRQIIVGNVAGAHKVEMELEIQARRTAGAGTIGVRPMGSYGRQT